MWGYVYFFKSKAAFFLPWIWFELLKEYHKHVIFTSPWRWDCIKISLRWQNDSNFKRETRWWREIQVSRSLSELHVSSSGQRDGDWGCRTPELWRRSALGNNSQAEPATFSQKAFSVSFTKPPHPISWGPLSLVWKNISSFLIITRCWTSKTLVKVEITSHHHMYWIFEVVLLLPD